METKTTTTTKTADYFYDAMSGDMFFDREHKEKIICTRHKKTQLTYDPINDVSCRRCRSFGFGVNLWNLKTRIEEYHKQKQKEVDVLIAKIANWD